MLRNKVFEMPVPEYLPSYYLICWPFNCLPIFVPGRPDKRKSTGSKTARGGPMKSALRVKASGRAKPLQQEFSDFEAMVPVGEGIRRTRKPAKSTIASADTEGQKAAATRARITAKSTGSKQRRST